MVLSLFLPLQHLRTTMPDQTRCILNSTVSSLSDPINGCHKNTEQTSQSESRPAGLTEVILQQQPSVISIDSSSPRVIRRYSKPQGNSYSELATDPDSRQESSVDGDPKELFLLEKFQKSVRESRLVRRRSSPDIVASTKNSILSQSRTNPQFSSSLESDSETNLSDDTSSPATSRATTVIKDYPVKTSAFPGQKSILGKMVGSRAFPQEQQQQQKTYNEATTHDSVSFSPSSSSSSSSSSLTPSKSCPKFHSFDDNLHVDIYDYSMQNCSSQSSVTPMSAQLKSSRTNNSQCSKCDTKSDSVDSSSSSSSSKFGFLSKTRQFGTWLGLSGEAGVEKVEISKKDLNVFAPTTF